MSDKECNATLVLREDLTDEIAVIRVSLDGCELTEFEPGQYAELAIPQPGEAKLVRRQYSIASAPSQKDSLEFFIVRVNDGAFTPRLFDLPIGGKIWMNPKLKGKFTLDPIPAEQHLVMISTGTGLAPFMSMLRQYYGTGRWKRLTMINCVRYSQDLGYRDELETLAEQDKNISYIPTVTREPEGSSWAGLRGRVQPIFEGTRFEELTGATLDPTDTHVLLCGNPEMIDQMLPILGEKGFKEHSKKDPGNIHFERYW